MINLFFFYSNHDRLQFFTAVENDNFQIKKCDVFLILAHNIDCGYTL